MAGLIRAEEIDENDIYEETSGAGVACSRNKYVMEEVSVRPWYRTDLTQPERRGRETPKIAPRRLRLERRTIQPKRARTERFALLDANISLIFAERQPTW